MNRFEYLLEKVQEECAEIIVAASKVKRFGPLNYHPDRPESNNTAELEQELADLWAVLDMLDTHGGIDLADIMNPERMDKIQGKVAHYMGISRECGTLID